MSAQNLDHICAEYGWEIAKQVCEAIKQNPENHIEKSLGVLQAHGVYAFFLYQESRGDRESDGAARLLSLAKELLEKAGIATFRESNKESEVLSSIREGLAQNLDLLLLAKRLLEQALIYARYHVKALEAKGNVENP